MRYLILLCLLFTAHLFAQPAGQLFVQSYQGDSLGYFDFPSGQYHFIDNTSASDLLVHKDRLYVATGYRYDRGGDVLVYDLNTLQRIDTIAGTYAEELAFWQDMLLVASTDSPLFKVYDANNGYQPVFDWLGIDQFESPRDVLVVEDRAYLVTTWRLATIDMITQDTLAVTQIGEFHIGGDHLIAHGEYIYIDMELFTAVPRRGLSRMHKDSLRTVNELFVGEFIWQSFPPVLVGDTLHLFHYPTFYDITQDSLHLTMMTDTFPIAYDEKSKSMILHSRLEGRFYYQQNGLWSAPSDSVGNRIMATYYHPQSATAISPTLTSPTFSIYPNPADQEVYIKGISGKNMEKTQLLDLKGRVLYEKNVGSQQDEIRIPLEGLPVGTYIVRILSEGKWLGAKVVKE